MSSGWNAIWTWIRASLAWFMSKIHPSVLMARFRSNSSDGPVEVAEEEDRPEPQQVDLGQRRIIVAGKETRKARKLRSFAQDFAELLGVECVVLWGARECDLRDYDYCPGDILVHDKVIRKDINTLLPFDEESLFGRDPTPRVFIPLSNDESGRFATEKSLPLIAKLGLKAVLWHTTWRDPKIPSAAARDHMCVEAKVTIPQVEEMVDAAGVRRETHVVMADSIQYGAAEAALDHHCRLIVMARGKLTGRGSYADDILTKSSVPVLIIGREAVRGPFRRGDDRYPSACSESSAEEVQS